MKPQTLINVIPAEAPKNVIPAEAPNNVIPAKAPNNIIPAKAPNNIIPAKAPNNVIPAKAGILLNPAILSLISLWIPAPDKNIRRRRSFAGTTRQWDNTDFAPFALMRDQLISGFSNRLHSAATAMLN